MRGSLNGLLNAISDEHHLHLLTLFILTSFFALPLASAVTTTTTIYARPWTALPVVKLDVCAWRSPKPPSPAPQEESPAAAQQQRSTAKNCVKLWTFLDSGSNGSPKVHDFFHKKLVDWNGHIGLESDDEIKYYVTPPEQGHTANPKRVLLNELNPAESDEVLLQVPYLAQLTPRKEGEHPLELKLLKKEFVSAEEWEEKWRIDAMLGADTYYRLGLAAKGPLTFHSEALGVDIYVGSFYPTGEPPQDPTQLKLVDTIVHWREELGQAKDHRNLPLPYYAFTLSPERVPIADGATVKSYREHLEKGALLKRIVKEASEIDAVVQKAVGKTQCGLTFLEMSSVRACKPLKQLEKEGINLEEYPEFCRDEVELLVDSGCQDSMMTIGLAEALRIDLRGLLTQERAVFFMDQHDRPAHTRMVEFYLQAEVQINNHVFKVDVAKTLTHLIGNEPLLLPALSAQSGRTTFIELLAPKQQQQSNNATTMPTPPPKLDFRKGELSIILSAGALRQLAPEIHPSRWTGLFAVKYHDGFGHALGGKGKIPLTSLDKFRARAHEPLPSD